MWVGNPVEKGEGTGIPKLVKVGGVGTGNNGAGGGKFTTPSPSPYFIAAYTLMFFDLLGMFGNKIPSQISKGARGKASKTSTWIHTRNRQIYVWKQQMFELNHFYLVMIKFLISVSNFKICS